MRGLAVDKDQAQRTRNPSRYCEICGEVTRERKPLCPDHILERGRPRELFEIIESVEREVAAASKIGARAVDLKGLVVEEILAGIAAQGQVTWRRLVKDHVAFLNSADAKTADAYLVKLRKAGLVEVTRTTRNIDVVTLSAAGFAFIKKTP